MPWADRVEVATVEGGDLAHPEPLGDGDDRRAGGTEREVGVGLDQLRHTLVVGQLQIDDRQGLLLLGTCCFSVIRFGLWAT